MLFILMKLLTCVMFRINLSLASSVFPFYAILIENSHFLPRPVQDEIRCINEFNLNFTCLLKQKLINIST